MWLALLISVCCSRQILNGGYEILSIAGQRQKIPTKSGVELHLARLPVAAITQPVDTLIIAGFTMPLLETGKHFSMAEDIC